MSSKDMKLGISLYSYQEAIWRGDLDLQGAMTAAKGAGTDGIEFFGEALMPSFPYVSDEFLYKWNYMLDNLQLEPVCYEHFADRKFRKDPSQYLTDDDLFASTLMYLQSAKRLGCKFIRLSHDGHNGIVSYAGGIVDTTINAPTFARLLPYAEELGVKMALEVHGPGTLDDGGNDDFVDAIEKTGCYGGGGLMLDFSSLLRDMTPIQEAAHIARGAKPEIVTYMREMSRKAFTYNGNNDVDWEEVEREILRMGGGEIELDILNAQGRGSANAVRYRTVSTPNVVREYASRLIYCHAKLHWINEDCTSDEIDYPTYFRALSEGGYKGYITTEFEGQCSVPHSLNEVEFVRRHQTMMRKCLEELEP